MILLQIAGNSGAFTDALESVYNTMKGHTNLLIGVGRSIGGLAALFYISFRVWKHMANGEPINFFPLLRPFVIGFCILIFPTLMDIINGILYSTVQGTEKLIPNWKKTSSTSPCDEVSFWYPSTWMPCASYTIVKAIIDILTYAVKTAINVLRIFFLIVLTIIGPIAFGLSIFDGFQETLTGWIKRYVNIYLWLPIANILEAIATLLNNQVSSGSSFGDWITYLAFQAVLILCYLKIPEISDWIVTSPIGGGGGFAGGLGSKAAGAPIAASKQTATAGGRAVARKAASFFRKK